MLNVAEKLDVCSLINQHIKSTRPYRAEKPTRNNLTAGISFLMAAMGRVSMPTSKRGWWVWAKTTSLEYLLRCSLSKIDSQHFWDLMDSLPVEAIEEIENELLKKVFDIYKLKSDTLFFDTTNFFTYINTTNTRCTVAQRGKNKQKRYDLRQVGLAMVVTRQDLIPLLHLTYQGNINDSKVFAEIIGKIKTRLSSLDLDIEKHTVVFDRGNNSKKNLAAIKELKLHYVGALTPYHHKDLIADAIAGFQTYDLDGTKIQVYRDRRIIWGNERTVIVFISEQLKEGQIRGVYHALDKQEKQLKQLQMQLSNPRSKPGDKKQVKNKILGILKGQYVNDLIEWSLEEKPQEQFDLQFSVDHQKLKEIEDSLGLRIIMSDRHQWNTTDIIKAYYGQSKIENAFKDLKNPYHLAVKPQFHWTDQKIKVHYFICVMGYLLSAILLRQAREKTKFKGSLDSLLDILCNIRLATLLEESDTRGKVKAVYKLEEMSKEEKLILQALEIENLHSNRPKLKGVGVYK
jgi:transposase